MKTGNSGSNRTGLMSLDKTPRAGLRRIALTTGLIILTFGGFSSAWAGDRLTTHVAPIHLAGFSIHIEPGGFHLGIGGHRHGYRGSYGYRGKHFGHRHYFKGGRHFYGRPHHFQGGRHFKGGRHHRRHRH